MCSDFCFFLTEFTVLFYKINIKYLFKSKMNGRCQVTPDRVCHLNRYSWTPPRLVEIAANEASIYIQLSYIYKKLPKFIFDIVYEQYKKNNGLNHYDKYV